MKQIKQKILLIGIFIFVVGFSFLPLTAEAALIDNIIAYYKLDDVNDAHDSFNLTNNNSATFVAGKIGNGVNLVKASSQYLSVANNLGVDGGAITISAWLKVGTQPASGEINIVASQFSNPTQTGYDLWYANNSGTLQVKGNRAKANVADTGTFFNFTFTADVWFHFVLTYDGTDIRTYIDGVLKDTTAASGNGTGSTASLTTIGSYHGGGTNNFDGVVDEVGYWSRALSSAEIEELYNNGNGLQYPFTKGPANLKSLNSILKANIKTINGILIADIKKWLNIE